MLQNVQVNGSKTWALEKMVSLLPEATERVLLLAERVLGQADFIPGKETLYQHKSIYQSERSHVNY